MKPNKSIITAGLSLLAFALFAQTQQNSNNNFNNPPNGRYNNEPNNGQLNQPNNRYNIGQMPNDQMQTPQRDTMSENAFKRAMKEDSLKNKK